MVFVDLEMICDTLVGHLAAPLWDPRFTELNHFELYTQPSIKRLHSLKVFISEGKVNRSNIFWYNS